MRQAGRLILNLRDVATRDAVYDMEKTNMDHGGGIDHMHISSVVDISGPWWRAEGYQVEPFSAHTEATSV
jgi:hypothetical protein